MKLILVAGARPNFMKIAPLYHVLKKEDWATPCIVHTGQHYDVKMSDAFFRDLELPNPDINLEVGSASHAVQTAEILTRFERVCLKEKPDWVVVVGDVNSTMACTLVASKLGIRVAHVEAGLRSFDRSMPEEINRLVTDVLADILFTPSEDANENLIREGISHDKIHRVGNIMIDSLEMLRGKIETQDVYRNFDLTPQGYGLVTLHRPSNVDGPEILRSLCQVLARIAEKAPLVFPIHPRTRKNLEQNQLLPILNNSKGLFLPDPLSYIRFMNMVFNCRFVITDSGGIQEETTYLGIPCLTLRPNTERPITITHGTNQLCELKDLEDKAEAILSGYVPQGKKIEFWDGKTASRIVAFLKELNAGAMLE